MSTHLRGATPPARRLAIGLAVLLLGLSTLALGSGAAGAQAVEPDLTVTPADDLLDGQVVTVELTGYGPESSVGVAQCDPGAINVYSCDWDTARFGTADSNGSWTTTMPLKRHYRGKDCAVDLCVLAAANIDLATGYTSGVTFAETSFRWVPDPESPFRVDVVEPAFTDGDEPSRATVSATLECDEATRVLVEFELWQAGPSGTVRGSNSLFVPCTPGEVLSITSDLMNGYDSNYVLSRFEPGPAEAVVSARVGLDTALAQGTVQLEPFSTVVARLQARLADPNDTTVVQELLASIAFRLQYNPVFAHDFWVAILNA